MSRLDKYMYDAHAGISNTLIDGLYMEMAHIENRKTDEKKHKGYNKLAKFLNKHFKIESLSFKEIKQMELEDKKEVIFAFLQHYRKVADTERRRIHEKE